MDSEFLREREAAVAEARKVVDGMTQAELAETRKMVDEILQHAADQGAPTLRVADEDGLRAKMRRFPLGERTEREEATGQRSGVGTPLNVAVAPVLREVEVTFCGSMVSIVFGVARMEVDDRERLRLLDAEGGLVAVFGDGLWQSARFRGVTRFAA